MTEAESREHQELFQVQSLLYTPEEINAYEHMLQGHSGEKSITRKFTSVGISQTINMCVSEKTCGVVLRFIV